MSGHLDCPNSFRHNNLFFCIGLDELGKNHEHERKTTAEERRRDCC